VYPFILGLPVSSLGKSKDEHFVILMNIRISSPVISTKGRNLFLISILFLAGEKSCVSRHPGIACLAFRQIEGRTLCHSDEYQNLFTSHFDPDLSGEKSFLKD
jgi:hypothetical protein